MAVLVPEHTLKFKAMPFSTQKYALRLFLLSHTAVPKTLTLSPSRNADSNEPFL